MNNIFVRDGNIFVTSDNDVMYSLRGSGKARNNFGYETGYTWLEEFEAGRLYVGQEEDGTSCGAVWAQEALPEPSANRNEEGE